MERDLFFQLQGLHITEEEQNCNVEVADDELDEADGNYENEAYCKLLINRSTNADSFRSLVPNWIMHEYRLADVDRSARKKNSLRLDDWVLCRIYNKKGIIEKQPPPPPQQVSMKSMGYDIETEDQTEEKPHILKDRQLSGHRVAAAAAPPPSSSDYMYFEPSDSIPRLHTESSCSEHVVSTSELASEVQSQPRTSSFAYNYMDASLDTAFGSQFQFPTLNQMSPLQDIFTYLQKPF